MSFFAGQVPGADKLYALSYADTYVPTLDAVTTPPNLGADGDSDGWYQRNGLLITGWARFFFSGTGLSGGSGYFRVPLPVDADVSIMSASTTSGLGSVIGSARLRDNSTGANSQIVGLTLISATQFAMNREGANLFVDGTNPITWDTDDRIMCQFAYIADPASLPFGT